MREQSDLLSPISVSLIAREVDRRRHLDRVLGLVVGQHVHAPLRLLIHVLIRGVFAVRATIVALLSELHELV